MVSFVTYLLRFKDEDSAVGDVARDMIRDPRINRRWGYTSLVEYLSKMNTVDRIYGILEEHHTIYKN